MNIKVEIIEKDSKKYMYFHYMKDGVDQKIYIGECSDELYNLLLNNDTSAKEQITNQIKRLYAEELGKKSKRKSIRMKNFEEYRAWCEEHGRLPRAAIIVNYKRINAAKKGGIETEEQREQRLGMARKTFSNSIRGKATLIEEQKQKNIIRM